MTHGHHNHGRDDGPIDQLVRAFANLPGLGPRSARRIALYLLSRKDSAMIPMIHALDHAAQSVRTCGTCGNLDMHDPCRVCADTSRNPRVLCVVAGVSDLWAIERTGAYRGRYHILGGLLSALDGVGPQDLRITALQDRARHDAFDEIILALAATVDGQATAHYITDRLRADANAESPMKITRLAHGIPVGGDLDYLDDGTISTALKSRA